MLKIFVVTISEVSVMKQVEIERFIFRLRGKIQLVESTFVYLFGSTVVQWICKSSCHYLFTGQRIFKVNLTQPLSCQLGFIDVRLIKGFNIIGSMLDNG